MTKELLERIDKLERFISQNSESIDSLSKKKDKLRIRIKQLEALIPELKKQILLFSKHIEKLEPMKKPK